MTERTINDEIDDQIDFKLNQLPKTIECTIIKVYDDGYTDIQFSDGSILNYVKTIGNPTINTNAIVIFINADSTKPIVVSADNFIMQKLGLNQSSADKFNFAIISKLKDTIQYEELWILANAYYDYTNERFVKINPHSTSFAIQIQGNGTYPGEEDYDVTNTGINFWRHPVKSQVTKDTTIYDYSDFDNKNYIGAKQLSNNEWVEFGISAGWNNSFMIDSYGGMTIGGNGFEIDGNGLYPYSRVTHSNVTINNNTYSLLGVLENAYHNSSGCDSNAQYSWFIGLLTPIIDGAKYNADASFVVMYNNTEYNENDTHTIDNTKWNILFESKIEQNEDWTDLQKTSNIIDYDSSLKLKYKKYGKLVEVNGIGQLNTTIAVGSNAIIGQLPTGYRPSRNQFFLCEMYNSLAIYRCTVNIYGELIISNVRDQTGEITADSSNVININLKFLVD